MKRLITLLMIFQSYFLISQSAGMQLLQQGIQLYQQNKGEQAVTKLSEAAQALKEDNEWANYATCQCGLANILSSYGSYEKANKVLDETFPVIEKNLAKNDAKLALCYLNKAMVELNQKSYHSAVPYLHKGYSIRKLLYQPTANENLEVVSLLSKVYIDLNQPDSSIIYCNIIENELEKRGQSESLPMADLYNTKGNALDLKKDFNSSIDYHTKSLAVRKKLTGSVSSEAAFSLGNLSLVFQNKGDYVNAEKYGLESYSIRKSLFGIKHEQTQLSVLNLASMYSEMGEWEKAMHYYELQRNYVEKINSKNENADYKLNYGTAQILSDMNISAGILNVKEAAQWYSSINDLNKLSICYQNLTLAYTNLSDYEEAKKYNAKATELKKQLGITDPENQLNAGNIFYYQNNNIKAINSYNNALSLYEKKYGFGHHKHITAIENIAAASTKINPAAARQVYQTLVSIHANNEIKQAEVFSKIGNVYLVYKQFDSALIYYNKAKAIYKNKSNHVGLLEIKNLEGIVALGMRKFNEAEKIFSEVLKTDVKRNTFFRCKTYNNLALVQFEQKMYDKSLKTIKEAFEENKTVTGEIKFQDEYLRTKKINFKCEAQAAIDGKNTSRLKNALNLFAELKTKKQTDAPDELLIKSGQADDMYKLNVLALNVSFCLFNLTNDESLLITASDIAEDCKSVSIKSALKDINYKKLSGVPQDLIIAERKMVEKCELLALSLNSEKISEEESSLFLAALTKLYSQQDSIRNLIKLKYPKYSQLKNATSLMTKDLQKKMAANEAVINFIFNSDFSCALIITAKKVYMVELKNKQASEANILAYRDGIDKNDFNAIASNAYQLYKNSFAAIDSQLIKEKITALTIIPDGSLYFFPFESLVRKAYTEKDNFATLDYIIKTYDVNYLYAASLFQDDNEKKSGAGKDYLGIAPVFADKNEVAQTRSAVFKTDMFGRKKRSFLSDGTYINPLPGTLEEVDAVSKYLSTKNKKCLVLKHEQANEKSLKEVKMEDYRFIHFATHGFVNEDQPNYSGLILAQNGDSEDNILFASEIYNLSLDADLVALSACQTGLGTVSEGEGLIGLSRGFLYAGAKNLLVSLWPVSDEGTSKLMVDFFSTQNSSAFTKSLRQSKLNLISNTSLASPFYWAPFILIGK